MDTTMTHSDYLTNLKRGIFEVSFNKVNGDQRVMTCTLNENVVPPATKTEPITQTKIREINENVVSVWDVKASGWRSFRVANVTDVKRIGGACRCGKTQDVLKVCDGSHKNA